MSRGGPADEVAPGAARGPSYFVSDLHVADPKRPGTARLLRWLGERRGEAAAVYLVGDAFDFWLGYRASMFTAAFPLLHRLAELVEHGTRVVWMTGNHDPDPGAFVQSLGIEVWDGPRGIELDGMRVWLDHGDLIDPRGWHHRAMCHLVRNPVARWIARLFHPDFAWRMSRLYAGAKTHRYDAPLPAGLFEAWLPERARQGFEVAIIGHYHRAVCHRGQDARLYALGDWVAQRTFLRYDGAFTLMRDRGPDEPARPLPEGDHGPDASND